jgi:hypothetical protein
MPIALESGDGGGRSGESRPIVPRRPRTSAPSPDIRDFTPDDRATFDLETGTRPVLVVIFRSRWVTAADERTCPVCAPLHGQVFLAGEGPVPPLHRSCRCRRVHAGAEVTSRAG